jgi:hypothetical protein
MVSMKYQSNTETKTDHIATGTTVQRVNIRVSADAIAVG